MKEILLILIGLYLVSLVYQFLRSFMSGSHAGIIAVSFLLMCTSEWSWVGCLILFCRYVIMPFTGKESKRRPRKPYKSDTSHYDYEEFRKRNAR
jgi:hypothetical protein